MGQIKVLGYAEREVECDMICYSLIFDAQARESLEAVVQVNRKIETFLEVMEKNGFAPEQFRTEHNSVSETFSCTENVTMYRATRTLALELAVSSMLPGKFMQLIEANAFDIQYSEIYVNTKIAEVRHELLKEAIEDSRRKAEEILSITGQTIKGVKTVLFGQGLDNSFRVAGSGNEEYCCKDTLSDRVGLPVQKESIDITIIWEI